MYDQGFVFPFMNISGSPKARNSFIILNGNIILIIFVFKKTRVKKKQLHSSVFCLMNSSLSGDLIYNNSEHLLNSS